MRRLPAAAWNLKKCPELIISSDFALYRKKQGIATFSVCCREQCVALEIYCRERIEAYLGLRRPFQLRDKGFGSLKTGGEGQ